MPLHKWLVQDGISMDVKFIIESNVKCFTKCVARTTWLCNSIIHTFTVFHIRGMRDLKIVYSLLIDYKNLHKKWFLLVNVRKKTSIYTARNITTMRSNWKMCLWMMWILGFYPIRHDHSSVSYVLKHTHTHT